MTYIYYHDNLNECRGLRQAALSISTFISLKCYAMNKKIFLENAKGLVHLQIL